MCNGRTVHGLDTAVDKDSEHSSKSSSDEEEEEEKDPFLARQDSTPPPPYAGSQSDTESTGAADPGSSSGLSNAKEPKESRFRKYKVSCN